MITTLEGPMGSGKSLTATTLAYLEHTNNGKKVVANYHLKFPYTYMDPIIFLEQIAGEELANCVHVLDEAYLLMDARVSGAKLNRLFTYYIAQTRKRNVDLYVCALHIDEVDKRLRRKADVRGTCSYQGEEPCRNCRCSACDGSGQVHGSKCSECNGVGGTGRVSKGRGLCATCGGTGTSGDNGGKCEECGGSGSGTICKRCLGYGVTGWATTRFVDFRKQKFFGSKRIRKIKLFGPAYWGLYDTTEIVPFLAKQTRIPVEDL